MRLLMNRCWVLVLLVLVHSPGVTAEDSPQLVHWDWYFRESLTAIDDWEAILAWCESEGESQTVNSVLPVPVDGQIVQWPNPIPRQLLPIDDRTHNVQLRLSGEQIVSVTTNRIKNVRGQEHSTDLSTTLHGYQHPGGGGHNQWYHRYVRRFDQLTHFLPQRSPVEVTIATPLDLHFGSNDVPLMLRNATSRPVNVKLQARLLRRQVTWKLDESNERLLVNKERVALLAVSKREVDLAEGEEQTIDLSVPLASPGGGLLLISLEADKRSFRVPILTCTEDIPSLLEGIRRILSDSPDPRAASGLAKLVDQTRSCLAAPETVATNTWRQLFLQASELRDALLLQRIDFDQLLLVKRKPYYSEQPFMDGHHCYNRPGGGIYGLSPVRPDGTIRPILDSLGLGIYRDLCLHWDAERLLFAFGNGSDRVSRTTGNALARTDGKSTYDLYEMRVDGSEVRRLTSSLKNDCEPFYLPDGRIGFTSDRSEHYVMCGSDIHGANLFTMEASGADVRQLSFNVFNEFNPSVLPDGRIVYNRWEYNERSVTSLHDLFTIHPDGTQVAPYYGNATSRPNVIMFPRPVPGSNKVMALFTGHHGQTHGPLALIDVRRGVDGPDPVTVLTPGVPTIGEKIEDSRRGWYSDPRPLSETTYLCSYTPTVLPWLENTWALYIGDRHGNLALIYRDPEISCAEPVPLVAQPVPRTLPSTVSRSPQQEATARLMLMDVYEGLPDVAHGKVKYLRILEDVPRKAVPTGGVICTSGTQIYTVKRIIGTVPIEDDGSAHFSVPANRNLYFEVLDEQRREIQRMRSVVCLKPGEQTTCIGCHEPRTQSPPPQTALAFYRPPSQPDPAPWGDRVFSYLRDVQPIINDACIECHTHDRLANHVILTDDLTDQFCVSYEELLPYLSVANAMRWDHPDDVQARPPYTYGSNVSQLSKMLRDGHHDVSLTDEQWRRLSIWIDTNAVYYDRYETYTNNRHIFLGDLRGQLEKVYARRCAQCHGDNHDGRFGAWWMSFNRRDVTNSRALLAPLAKGSGGWQSCGEVVFADTQDTDYQEMYGALNSLFAAMQQNPRADLRSIAGTPAEIQPIQLPAPPTRSMATTTTLDADGQWVYLSDLPWTSARAGWTSNQDGQPRRNRDVSGKPLRFGARIYPKGIGTHAPSEIVYDLLGRYSRFQANVGGGEANGTVVFQVFADEELIFDSGIMHGLRSTKSIDLSIRDVQVLKLVVTDGGNDYFCDMATWANARVLRTTVDE